jgi:octaprenyl-diphosphate synthase
MSEGELLQLEKARKLDINEEIYYQIIRKKTASLIGSCMAAGTASVRNEPEAIDKMYRIGENAGMAFQIKDDLFDLEFRSSTGKPSGIDIQEKKMTLPMIYLLNNSSAIEKRKVINVVKNHSSDIRKVAWLIGRIRESGGVDYAQQQMDTFKNTAIAMLRAFPQNPSREALIHLIDYTVERTK